jgi:SprT protein
LPEQLELFDCSRPALSGRFAFEGRGDRAPRLQQDVDLAIVGQAHRLPSADEMASEALALQTKARELLRGFGFNERVRVKWNARLKSCAGRADFREKLITLNPRLHDHAHEIERTLLHELAHLLAQFRAGRKRIAPHGKEWRAACVDLGIGDEKRCHDLPFAITERIRRFLYQCPNCRRDFPRARRVSRAIACLACCRKHNGGDFDARFRLQLIR